MKPGTNIRFRRTIPSDFEGSPPLAELNELGTIQGHALTHKMRVAGFVQVLTERGTLLEAGAEDFEEVM